MTDYQLFIRTAAIISLMMACICFVESNSCAQNPEVVFPAPTTLAQGMTNAAGEEIAHPVSGFVAVVTLDDKKLESLLKDGQLEIAIPKQLTNSIDSITMKRPVYFKDQDASQFADATLKGQKLYVNIDELALERIDYQPIDLKVYETGYSSIVLKYFGTTRGRSKLDEIGDAKTDSAFVMIKLKSGKGIQGRIKGLKSIPISSNLGDISLSIGNTRSIEIGAENRLTAKMLNGDLISGSTSMTSVELLTRWENETLKLSDIAEIIVRKNEIILSNNQQKPKQSNRR